MLTGILLFFLFLFSVSLDDNYRKFFLDEGGLIESATALGYFLCITLIVYQGRIAYIKKYYYIFLLIIFFMLRELDFDTRFTTTGMFKLRFFTSSTVPLLEKIIGVMIIVLLLYIIFIILHRHLKDFLINLRKREIISVGVLITCALLAVSQSFDGFDRKLKGLGIEVSHQLSIHTNALEEIAELGIPIIILITVSAFFRKSRLSHKTPQS